LTKSLKDEAGGGIGVTEFLFPKFITCHSCGAQRRVIRRELCEMPEGVAGVALANCRKCHHTFVRFIGEKKPAARLMKKWLGIQQE
jgi:hypothetical protein